MNDFGFWPPARRAYAYGDFGFKKESNLEK